MMIAGLIDAAIAPNVFTLLHEAQVIVGKIIIAFLRTDYLSAIATLAAAFFGARFAFQFQQNEKTKELKELQIARANAALQRILRMVNIVGDYKVKVVDPVRHMGPAAAINMGSTLSEDVSREHFDVAELSFMVTKEEQEAVFDLWLEERRFHNLMQVIDRRSKLHHDEYQPVAEAKMLHERRDLTLPILRVEVGPRLIDGLESLTNFILRDVDDTLASMIAAKDRLRAALQLRFPGQKFLDFNLQMPETHLSKQPDSP
ncbi:hypothetical protein [Stenotrophomonas sepilia]|uniref:hypothetical protein n=1 Tax=Stenotrophomonas sepilia TaxID=2860290 RepID=UPI002E780E06|nr:hypothetical protein [Stenotrophomonas sepilia]